MGNKYRHNGTNILINTHIHTQTLPCTHKHEHTYIHIYSQKWAYTHTCSHTVINTHIETRTQTHIYRYEGLLSVSRDLIFLQAFGRPESIVGDTTERVVSRIMWLSSEFRTTQSLLCIFYSIFETRSDKFFLTRVHHSNMSIYMRQIVEVKVMKSWL